ncbi:MAG: aminoacyl-tRNA hydrolase [Alphaproteobacteria bacterium]|nr:aminoacyl-tRNA hydrolase [Alphaproteobacteria bacterium]HPF45728.1 alternative ribosome rescue aminoacyl-tRNA hydrolase ArfB [Emcibacteraceae bacterium]
MFTISNTLKIDESDIDIRFIRSPGPGGQHVNKVESAVQIRFNALENNAINEAMYKRLKIISGQRMTSEGIIILTANSTRSQIRNRDEAIQRLVDMLKEASIIPKARKKTKPTLASKTRRLESKKKKGTIKKLRGQKIVD